MIIKLTNETVIVEVVDLEGEGGLDVASGLLWEGAVQVEEVFEGEGAVGLRAEHLKTIEEEVDFKLCPVQELDPPSLWKLIKASKEREPSHFELATWKHWKT